MGAGGAVAVNAVYVGKAGMPIQFVSLGPGEAELITLKGLKALQNADCIFCPETPVRDGHSLSRAADIMLRLDIPANRIRRFSLPMSKQRTDALNAYPRNI